MQTSDTVGIYPDLAGKVAVVTGGSGGDSSLEPKLSGREASFQL